MNMDDPAGKNTAFIELATRVFSAIETNPEVSQPEDENEINKNEDIIPNEEKQEEKDFTTWSTEPSSTKKSIFEMETFVADDNYDEELMEYQKSNYKVYTFNLGKNFPWFTVVVTLIELIELIAAIIANGGFEPLSNNPWFGISTQTAIDFGGKYNPPMIDDGQWWRFITPMFLHVGIIHYLMNMILQIPIGWQLERIMGWWRIGFIYLISGIAGNLLSALFLPRLVSVGASSSLYGWLSIYFIDLIVNWNFYSGPKIKLIIWIIATVFSLALGVFPAVDNFAHIGGSIGGVFGTMMVANTVFSRNGKENYSLNCIRIWGWILMLGYFIPGFVLFYTRVDVSQLCPICEDLNCLPVWKWCREYTGSGYNYNSTRSIFL